MTETEFKRKCVERGFARIGPRQYARCYGDGIYQTIYTGFRSYVDPFSEDYDPEKRKSNYVSIGIHSMYSRYPERMFAPGPMPGAYEPDNILGNQEIRRDPFLPYGIEKYYEKMCEYGFDALDGIDSQRKMLDLWYATHKHGMKHDFYEVASPLLMCAETDDAMLEISFSYARDMIFFHNSKGHLLENGAMEAYIEAEKEALQRNQYEHTLFCAVIGRKEAGVYHILKENFERNLQWVQKYKIPVMPNDQFGVIGQIFK